MCILVWVLDGGGAHDFSSDVFDENCSHTARNGMVFRQYDFSCALSNGSSVTSSGHRYCIQKAFPRCEFVCEFSSYWNYITLCRKYCIYMDFDRCEYVYDFVMVDGSYTVYDNRIPTDQHESATGR